MLAQTMAVVGRRKDARACVIELGRLARMPESPPAPRDWRGGSKLCAPSEGLLGDVIVNAREIQSPEKFHALKPVQFPFTFAQRVRTTSNSFTRCKRQSEESHNSFPCVQ